MIFIVERHCKWDNFPCQWPEHEIVAAVANAHSSLFANFRQRYRQIVRFLGKTTFPRLTLAQTLHMGYIPIMPESNEEQKMIESRGDLALTASLRLLSPLVTMLLHEGINYTRFAQALKQVFLEAAAQILAERDGRSNDSSISVLSGVHRKDVREWRNVGKPRAPAKTLSVAMEVYTRWASDPAYGDDQGEPQLLGYGGAANSFEELAASVSTDVHPRTVLDELLRLGVVTAVSAAGETTPSQLRLCAGAFVPREDYAEMLQLFAANVGDHIATATRNLAGPEAPLLEQSVFADGLSAESALMLGELARKLWAGVFQEMVNAATRLTQQDQGLPGAEERVRLGMYFHNARNELP